MVVDQHDDQLDPFLDRRDDLAAHHQVGAVADHGEDLAIGGGHLDPECAGDLIAHAGVAVLDVVLLRVSRAPQLVQVARHRAGGTDDDVAWTRRVIDRPDDLTLRRDRLMAEVVQPLDLAVPVLVEAGGDFAV